MKIKNISKKKIKKQISTVQEEIEKDYYRLIKKMDVIFKKEFGKMCPDFECECIQCNVHLIYNNFKKQLWEAFVK